MIGDFIKKHDRDQPPWNEKRFRKKIGANKKAEIQYPYNKQGYNYQAANEDNFFFGKKP